MTKIITDICLDENFPEITDEDCTFTGDCEVFGAPASFHLTIEARSEEYAPRAFVSWDEPHPAPLGAERLEAAMLSALGVEELRRLQTVAGYARLESDPDWRRDWVPACWIPYLESDDPTGLSAEDAEACAKWVNAVCAAGWTWRGCESTWDSPVFIFCDAIGLHAACLPVWFERDSTAA